MLKSLSRVAGGTLCALGLVSIVASGVLTAVEEFSDWPAFSSVTSKLVAEYSYFTLWSAIIGTIVAGTYALGWGSKSTMLARVARLDAAMMLMVTGLVYNLIIADGTPKHGWWWFTNFVNHELLPVAMPLLWVATMPLRGRPDITFSTVLRALIVPTVWVVYCLARGAATGFYPYDFLNVTHLGLPHALINITGVYCLFFVLVAVLAGVERLLSRRTDPSAITRLHAYRAGSHREGLRQEGCYRDGSYREGSYPAAV